MRKPFRPLLLGTVLFALPPVGDDGARPQPGSFGQVGAQSGDVRLADALAHEDTYGGAIQGLACVAGGKGGFALLWRDHREGMMGIYLGRFDRDGKMREPERPIHQPHAGRRLQPGLTVDADGAGVALWTMDTTLFAHAFDEKGRWQGADEPLTEDSAEPQERGGRGRGVQLPATAALDGGGFAVAWTSDGALLWREISRDGAKRAETRRLNPREQQADPGVQLCGGGRKPPLAIWNAGGRMWASSLRNTKAQAHDVGPGTLVRSAAADDGGAWLLFSGEKGSSIRLLHPDGRPDGEPITVSEGGEQALDIAVIGSKVAVLVQTRGANPGETPGRGRGGRTQAATAGASFQLRLVEAAHPENAQTIECFSAEAKLAGTPLVASDGTRLLVAWTDMREGDPDIYARLVAPGAEPTLLPEFRVNTDRASADQGNYRVDASGSEGIVTWIDRRDNPPRAYARRIAAPGKFQGGEFLLPGQDPKATPGAVAPALRPDGSCAFLWGGPESNLRILVLGADGKTIGETSEPGEAKEPAIVALPGDGGWMCAWIGSEPAVWALRVDTKGVRVGEKRRLSRESPAALGNVSLCFLGERRLAFAWDAEDGGWKLRGRLAGLDGAPLGEEFEFEGSPRHQDWDPALAATGNGGFVAAWTSGAPDDGSRDVVARFFDDKARPSGPLLWISPTVNEQDFADVVRLSDGTWAVGWEDDISGYDHTYVRRIQRDQRQLGPIVRINVLATLSNEDRVAPRLAPLADGLLSAFGDRARSLGWDVRVRIMGPAFDTALRR